MTRPVGWGPRAGPALTPTLTTPIQRAKLELARHPARNGGSQGPGGGPRRDPCRPLLGVEVQARRVTDRCSHLHCVRLQPHTCVYVHVCAHSAHVLGCTCACAHVGTRVCTQCRCQHVRACPCTFWYMWVCRHACTQSMCVSVHMFMYMWVCVVWVHAHVWCMCRRAQTSALVFGTPPGTLSASPLSVVSGSHCSLLLRRLLKCKAKLAPSPGLGIRRLPTQQACRAALCPPGSVLRSHAQRPFPRFCQQVPGGQRVTWRRGSE